MIGLIISLLPVVSLQEQDAATIIMVASNKYFVAKDHEGGQGPDGFAQGSRKNTLHTSSR
jgi:hypothetical protein